MSLSHLMPLAGLAVGPLLVNVPVDETFEHVHASGRFTATPAEEEAALDDYMRRADLLTTTEVDANLRARCLREPGFIGVFGNKGPRDDCGFAIRRSRFDLLEGGTKTLSPLRYMTEQGHLSDTTEGAYGVLKDKSTRLVGVLVVVHMPHGMQDALRKGAVGDDVAKAYRDILRGAKHLANGLARNHQADWTMIVGDWNLNVKSVWVPVYLKAQFPTYHVNFKRPFPHRGTFGSSLIDLAMLRGLLVVKGNPRILSHKVGFDHVGWAQTIGAY